jgi:hypothetical protein
MGGAPFSMGLEVDASSAEDQGMKRATVIGVIGFLLGAATSPKAANQNEALTLLCKRWKDSGGDYMSNTVMPQRDAAVYFVHRMVCGDVIAPIK